MREVEIVKIDISTKKAHKVKDYVAEEKPLHIFVNKAYYVTVFCSPSNLKELALGHLLSEGILKSLEEIEEISLKNEACHVKIKSNIDIKKRLKLSKQFSRIITSACGSHLAYPFSRKIPKINSNLKVKAETILNSVKNLNFIAETFRKTGGVHAAAIHKNDGELVAFAEDVGRHNAVDKAIGMAALNKTDFGACFLAVSGRLTGDMILKAGRVGLPIIASLAAALDSGIAIAKDLGLTLIGFVRGKRMNIYACSERILN
ncbi:MAG: formate dehydrogenase accessory sulfurtransferase FdhD [Candidatus Bathyarchaeota archaeon]|jgi:FdhD protein|nr:formate dehydrogenase accessory sulfurtransferase FdhD [Candidatus Bathyarchaeota archaeon]